MDAAGRALALSTSGFMRGVALGIPASTVRRVTQALLAHGRVRRGYLGVGSYPVALPAALRESLGQPTGLLVVSVEDDSPAAPGDRLPAEGRLLVAEDLAVSARS